MAAALRQTGIPVLGRIPWGAHICLFYETKQDLLDAGVAYFKTGLQSNDYCVWAISDPITEQEARAALASGVPDFESHLAEGRIELVPGREWYCSGEEFDMQRITAGWYTKLRGAIAKGFEGMRASGNAFWLATDRWKDFLQYEHEVNRSLAGHAMIVLCTYPLNVSRGMDVIEVAHAHNVTITRRQGAWEVVEAFEASREASGLTPPRA